MANISITTQPTKTSYVEGESFDPTGMVVTATYSDNSTAVVTDYTYVPGGALATTDTEVVVSYGGKSASVSVTVEAAAAQIIGIAVTTQPTTTVYTEGESFDPTGMVVTATYDDNSTAEINDYTYFPSGALGVSDDTIVIEYESFSTSVSITVEAAPEPTPDESYVDNANNIELDITNDETTGTSSFVLDNNGTEISGTAYASVPQSVGVTEAYFLQYEVNNAPKFALAEITESGGVQTITITDDKAIYNNVILPNNEEAYIPLTPTEHKGSYDAEVDAVTGATGYKILFDSTAPQLASLTIPVGVPVDIEMGDYGYVNDVVYTGGTKSQFESNVTITTNNTQITSVEYGSEDIFNLLFWETSVYDLEFGSPDNTFTRTDSTISDVNKLSGTWEYVEDPQTGDSVWALTYLDDTTEVFNVTYDEDDNQVVTHVDANA